MFNHISAGSSVLHAASLAASAVYMHLSWSRRSQPTLKIDAHMTITLAHTQLQPISLRSSVHLDIVYICRSIHIRASACVCFQCCKLPSVQHSHSRLPWGHLDLFTAIRLQRDDGIGPSHLPTQPLWWYELSIITLTWSCKTDYTPDSVVQVIVVKLKMSI